MTIYISTGCCPNLSADKYSEELVKAGINSIELSGGAYSKNVIDNLCKFEKKVKFQVHNYFPPPKIPFVLNLASQNSEILNLSLSHVDYALDCCLKLGATYYSFHAGFLCDLKVSELGSQIKKRKLYNREKSIDCFLKSVSSISKKAENKGIKIMIENNVLSTKTKNEFHGNPLLMCDAEECVKIIKQVPQNVKLLLDVAHLKVSAKSIGFDPIEMMKKCDDCVGGYHLSDNDGLSDTNETFLKDAWFLKYLKPDLDYYSMEVYEKSTNKMKKLIDIVNQYLSKK